VGDQGEVHIGRNSTWVSCAMPKSKRPSSEGKVISKRTKKEVRGEKRKGLGGSLETDPAGSPPAKNPERFAS